MRSTFFLFFYNFLFLLFGFSIGASGKDKVREVVNLNREWKYAQGDFEGAERIDFNDSQWQHVGIPHSFSIPYFMSKDFYVGYGWYRRSFDLKDADLKKRVFLEFDGVFQEAEVFVNGKKVGNHVGGYTGFSFDITSEVHRDHNLLAVRVNNNWKANVAPRAGEHTFSGGIYRNVRLVKKEKIYIDWYGTCIMTPDLGKNQGTSSRVKIMTDVCNTGNKDGSYTLMSEVFDRNGKSVARVSTTKKIMAGKTLRFVQQTFPVQTPLLWSPQCPNLYKVVSILSNGKRVLDCTETSFGFRWCEWSAEKGFYLNGKHLFFKGVNVHQDQAGWGDAVTDAAARRDVAMVKDAGFDLIRGSHYPHSPAFTEACDELGMMFWSEAPFWGIGGFEEDGYWNASAYPVHAQDEEDFEQSVLDQLTEMIRIHRNHPSVIVWSMCNEVFFSKNEVMIGVRRLLKRMVDLSHRLDPTRKVVIGGAQRPLGKDRIDMLGDIAGYNGDGATQPDFQRPLLPSVISEYGSTTADRPGEYIAGWGDLEKNDGWKGYEWRSGQAIWCGFDHGSIAGSQLGKMGIIDYFRLPKRSWYWYRNEYSHIAPPQWPIDGEAAQIHLFASKTEKILADGTDDVFLSVSLSDVQGREISAEQPITLTLIQGPGEFPTGKSITFEKDSDIRIMDGKAAISFRSYYAGNSVIEASSPGLQSVRINLHFVGAPLYVGDKEQIVGDRPYTRFVNGPRVNKEQTFGLNNPTFCSSYASFHVSGMASDGDENSYWAPLSTDDHPYWILDTEKGLEIHNIFIAFSRKGVYGFRIEISKDGHEWMVVKNCTENCQAILHQEIQLKDNCFGRFVRVAFVTGKGLERPSLSEVRVKGFIQ